MPRLLLFLLRVVHEVWVSDNEKSASLLCVWVASSPPSLLGITHNNFLLRVRVCLNDSRGLGSRVCECQRGVVGYCVLLCLLIL